MAGERLRPIGEVAKELGLDPAGLMQFGPQMAKLDWSMLAPAETAPSGKIILVSAINPTRAGEGKTTVSIGLAEGLRQLGERTLLALREPSLGPIFGIKGGGTGGGACRLEPSQRINMHFTSDLHAVAASHNLLEVVSLTLLGSEDKIRQRIALLGLNLDNINIIDPRNSELRQRFADSYYELRKHKGISREMAYDTMGDVSYFGTMMIHHGLADGMVSGAAHTTQHTIRPSFEIIRTKPGCSLISSVFFMCLEDRVLVYGDCAINPNPSAEQLADIAISSAGTAQMFGIDPRVAMLSYSTGQSGKGDDVETVREAVTIANRLRPDLKLEGPIQYDAAIDPDVAESKLPGSQVAGQATIFIFPDLNTGNNTYKAVQRSANAVAIGPVIQGLNKPVNDLSRGCTITDIVNTVAITAIQAQESDMVECSQESAA